MSDRKLAKAVRRLFREIAKLYRKLTKAMVTWLLRSAFVSRRSRRSATSGFVLPTATLLVLVVGLTAGALTFRAYNTSTRAISETQSRVIYNAATPAIDRARAKLEYLFDASKDTRYPGGIPSEGLLTSMMLNKEDTEIKGAKANFVLTLNDDTSDPYTLPGETRIDLNNQDGQGKPDNAWMFRADSDGNGDFDATVIYSVIFSTPPDETDPVTGDTTSFGANKLIALTDAAKVTGANLGTGGTQHSLSYVRGGPLSNTKPSRCSSGTGSSVEAGWYEDASNPSVLRKNFQVDALVIPDTAAAGGQGNFSTLEYQQDRKLNRGSKWGAWFRNDLEIYPGSAKFNWNGAMHTEGSLIIGETNRDTFEAYLISAPDSCLFYESASEITVTGEDKRNKSNFRGALVSGNLRANDTGGTKSAIHLHKDVFANEADIVRTLDPSKDWVTEGVGVPYNISLDPEKVQVDDLNNPRSSALTVAVNEEFKDRIKQKFEVAPYVDDTYRADNRYGPKRVYTQEVSIPGGSGKDSGDPIAQTHFTGDDAKKFDALTEEKEGLDGYWERQARNEGLRILVGQRLELGNTNGWVTPQDRPNAAAQDPKSLTVAKGDEDFIDKRHRDYTQVTDAADYASNNFAKIPDPDTSDNEGDPLYPSHSAATLSHEAQQRRALRDNTAAVQSAAIYHAAVSKDEPIACLASTAHPGTPFSLAQSINFIPTYFKNGTTATDTGFITDFLNGHGTNGWEFEFEEEPNKFKSNIDTATSPLRIALQNLANFAGDPDGAFPPKQEAGKVHPDPTLTMWGDFSNLRRTLTAMNGGTTYANLSPADKTYLHTATCTLGMLAYQLNEIQKFDPTNKQNDTVRPGTAIVMDQLGQRLSELMNGRVDDGEVLPKEQLATYDYDPTKPDMLPPGKILDYNPRDYDRVPAEMWLGKLRETLIAEGKTANDPLIRTAELIYSYFQVRRDRTFGFRPSPAANTWNYNPFVVASWPTTKVNLWSSACDPFMFAFKTESEATSKERAEAYLPFQSSTSPATRVAEGVRRLGLSRLCGTVVPPGSRDLPGNNAYPLWGDTTLDAELRPGKFGLEANTVAHEANPAFDSAFITSTINANYRKPAYTMGTVLPRFPALYYLFPERQHDLDGAVEKVGNYYIDHRQPGNTTDVGAPATLYPAIGSLIAAYQPWVEPYIDSAIVKAANTTTAAVYTPVSTTAASNNNVEIIAGYKAARQAFQDPQNTNGPPLEYTYQAGAGGVNDTPAILAEDTSLADIALKPRKPGLGGPAILTGSNWQLPIKALPASLPAQNNPPNRILAPTGTGLGTTTAIIPFLDRVMFNGREGLPTRVMDIDLGMLRREAVASDKDIWLPVSGLVYAFREDALREDGINRPADAANKKTNATNLSTPVDPPLLPKSANVSIKAVDLVPDPARRPHGFRLRNGTQLARHKDLVGKVTNFAADKNIVGMTFLTDSPAFIMGNYNLHQPVETEDEGDPDLQSRRIEEFTTRLPDDRVYSFKEFYLDRKEIDPRFAKAPNNDGDRWRPSEVLADAVGILSERFCDGSALDTFMTAGKDTDAVLDGTGKGTYLGLTKTTNGQELANALYPYIAKTGDAGGATVYRNPAQGFYDVQSTQDTVRACDGGQTSFLNQNRPNNKKIDLSAIVLDSNWSWQRENPNDVLSPVKLSRNGSPMLVPPPRTKVPSTPEEKAFAQKPQVAADYGGGYYQIYDNKNSQKFERPLQLARPTRVNSTLVSGIVPSNSQQSYGGLQNFPRMLESWRNTSDTSIPLWFAGSFLQLSFSNYATAPFDLDAVEPDQSPKPGEEGQGYYKGPTRLWGYDPALQKAKAGPVAKRFVTPDINRDEFYTEVAASDPYINKLCEAVQKTTLSLPKNPPDNTSAIDFSKLKCPS
jgi:hypothetical protein